MKQLRIFTTTLLISFFVFLVACVSVTLKTDGPQTAQGLVYEEPQGQFKRTSDKVFPSWIQEKTGHIISLMSECGNADPSLEALQAEAMQSIDEAQLIKEERINYQQKEALKTTFSGKINNVDTKVQSLVFKKSNCSFTFTFAGRKQNFESEIKHFEKLLESVKVP